MQGSASGYFGAMADEYDSLIRRAVPRYDEMIDRLCDYLPVEAARVLELGSATRNLSLRRARSLHSARRATAPARRRRLRRSRLRLAQLDLGYPHRGSQIGGLDAMKAVLAALLLLPSVAWAACPKPAELIAKARAVLKAE